MVNNDQRFTRFSENNELCDVLHKNAKAIIEILGNPRVVEVLKNKDLIKALSNKTVVSKLLEFQWIELSDRELATFYPQDPGVQVDASHDLKCGTPYFVSIRWSNMKPFPTRPITSLTILRHDHDVAIIDQEKGVDVTVNEHQSKDKGCFTFKVCFEDPGQHSVEAQLLDEKIPLDIRAPVQVNKFDFNVS